MSDLQQIQMDMMAYLLGKKNTIKSAVMDAGVVSVKERLAIYGDGYGYRLLDALSENYPAVHTLLGDEDFYRIAYEYIDEYPSQHFSLRYLGSELEAFFHKHYSDTPIFAEMAKFEWALRYAFDAKDTEPLTIEALQDIPLEGWGDLTFVFHDSMSRLDLSWNTPQLWSAIDEENDPISPEELEHPYAWLVWRKSLLNHYRSLDVDEAWALDASLNRTTFGKLCEGVCEWVDPEHAPARVAGFVTNWIQEGLIISFEY